MIKIKNSGEEGASSNSILPNPTRNSNTNCFQGAAANKGKR